MQEKRKLSTILFADIAGYTALMQEDETHALTLLNSFKDILERVVPNYLGEIVQYFGDGTLLSFDSATNGVSCAVELQQTFIGEKIPVRIGMHLGDVLAKGGNLFGDGVNIASRIESISVPGSLLVSKTVRDQIKNKAGLELVSLGDFQFKNVHEPIEVYALVNDVIRLPDRKRMQGKIVPSKQKRLRWPFILVGVMMMFLAIFLWQQLQEPDNLNVEGVLQEKIREKRVAVMIFENETGNADYEMFGKMISDWITNGLMETGTANIINAANIEQKIQRIGVEAKPEFVLATGLDMMLTGRYYRIDDEIYIQSNLIDASNGKVIHALELIKGSEKDLTALLRMFTQEVLGYWAVKDYSRFLDNPPTYEAFQEWIVAEELFVPQPSKAIEHIKVAFRLDSTFYSPLISLYSLYNKEGRHSERDSLFQFLSEKSDQFTKWEKLRYKELQYIRDKEWLTVARLAEQRYHMDISDQQALSVAVNAYNNANYPTKALELLNNFDTTYLRQDLSELRWLETDQVFPSYLLKKYKRIDSIADNFDRAKIPDAFAIMHMYSLVHMDSINRLAYFYRKYKEKGIYNNSGRPTPFYSASIMVCNMLYITDKTDVLEIYLDKLRAILSNEPTHPRKYEIQGYIYFFSGDMKNAALAWEKDELNTRDWPGWLWKALQYDRLSRIGYCYAAMKNETETKRYIDLIQKIESKGAENRNIEQYYISRILAASNSPGAANQSLEQAVKNGFSFYGPVRFNHDLFLKPIFNSVRFQELIKPH